MKRLKMWQNSNTWGRHGKNQNDIHDEKRSIINLGECLLLFSPKSFVFPSRIKKPKD